MISPLFMRLETAFNRPEIKNYFDTINIFILLQTLR